MLFFLQDLRGGTVYFFASILAKNVMRKLLPQLFIHGNDKKSGKNLFSFSGRSAAFLID